MNRRSDLQLRDLRRPFCLFGPLRSFATLLLTLLLATSAPAKTDPTSQPAQPPQTPREFYNAGSAELVKGNLKEAEAWLRRAAATNEEPVQPAAVYNLGHVRFLQGKETLKGENSRQPMLDSAAAGTVLAEEAIRHGQEALQSDELQQIIQAYAQGRAVRKQLRNSRDEISRTLKLYGTALSRWRRAAGDFQSAFELNAKDEDADFNAKAVERHIEELLKLKKQLEMQGEGVEDKREELKKVMGALQKKIPKEMQRQSDDEEEDSDEEEGQQPPPGGPQQQQQRIGGEHEVSPEMAEWLKETMKQRKMSVQEAGESQKEPKNNKKGRDW